jgi:hypothetical protein
MNVLNILAVVIPLLEGVLSAVTKAQLPQEVIQAVASAIAALNQVHGTEVTREQLESLRVTPQW